MKTFTGAATLLAIAILALPIPTVAAREFTNKNGVKLDANIVKVIGPKVVIRRADSKEFTVPIDSLSEADQKYIAEWKKENVSANFRYRFNKKRLERKRRAGGKLESWAYEVVINNSGLEDIGKLEVKYTLFKTLRDRYAKKKNTVSVTGSGKADVAGIKRGGSSTFQTEGAFMTSNNSITSNRTGSNTITDTYRKWDETLSGIQLMIYHEGKLIATENFGTTEPSNQRAAPSSTSRRIIDSQ